MHEHNWEHDWLFFKQWKFLARDTVSSRRGKVDVTRNLAC